MTSPLIRRSRPEDDEAILRVYNTIQSDFVPMSVEFYRHWYRTRPPGTFLERYVAVAGDEIVGSLDLAERHEYAEPGVYQAYLDVAPDHRGRGIGGALFELAERRAREQGARALRALVRAHHSESISFAAHRGMRPTARIDRPSRLDVSRANLARSDERERALATEGILIRTLAETGFTDQEMLRRIMLLAHEAGSDIPGSPPRPSPDFDRWLADLTTNPNKSPDRFWIAFEGDQPVGVAWLGAIAGEHADNGLTGVARSHRGRGVARALKGRTVHWARDNGIHYIHTANNVANAPMLAINTDLGYQPLPEEIEMEKEI
ncbi:MAG TPA: GNAT family N-acetyltransferase [Chloroflexota bacterium]|nr:GNAT family N-acetyltransferase [Chloroflexota bacterium]